MKLHHMLAAAILLASCAAPTSVTEPEQHLTIQERANLECVRKRIAAGDTTYEAAVTAIILTHAGKPGPIDLGEPCKRSKGNA